MTETNNDNFDERFDSGESILDYFETGMVLSIHRLEEFAPFLDLPALAREAGINVQTLQAKIRRKTSMSGSEMTRNINALRKHHLMTVA